MDRRFAAHRTLHRIRDLSSGPNAPMTTTASSPRQQQQPHTEPVVLFVVPPFQALQTPSLGVSQLTANLDAAGFRSEVLYVTLSFAERIGPNLYEWLAATGPHLTGDFLFSRVGHERTEGDVQRYLQEVAAKSEIEAELVKRFPGESPADVLERLIGDATECVHTDAVPKILARNPWMVGFSSTFQANCSSLAIIRELKRQRPDIVTVIGGANCETEMGEELMARYPEIDFVGRGECDRTLVSLVRALRAGETGAGIEGFLARGEGPPTCPSHPLLGPDLDANPHPDFDDYFAQLSAVGYRNQISPGLAMETSRGCWWGMKSHCTFCAFNRDGMIFRAKTPSRVSEEMSAQIDRYGISLMEMTDNILDMGYFKTLLPQLAEQPMAELFWETKSNLSREQIRLMSRAGVRWIQPGIESLSDQTLKLMRKGSTGLQNILLLKSCAESGIRITWNWLFGFPGESEDELATLARTVAAIHHLQPPSSSPVIYMERFAPYQTTPEEWGLEPIRPAEAYRHVYPFPDESLRRLAFFYECDFFKSKEGGPAHQRLKEIVADWNKAHSSSHLVAIRRRKSLILLDTRPCSTRRVRRLTGLRQRIYEYCGQIRGGRDVARAFEADATPEEVTSILQSFVADSLLLESNGRFLGLATDASEGYKDFPAQFPGGAVLSPRPRRSRRRRIFDAVTLRTPPRRIVRAVGHRLAALRITATKRLIVVLSRRLSQPQLSDASPAPTTEVQREPGPSLTGT